MGPWLSPVLLLQLMDTKIRTGLVSGKENGWEDERFDRNFFDIEDSRIPPHKLFMWVGKWTDRDTNKLRKTTTTKRTLPTTRVSWPKGPLLRSSGTIRHCVNPRVDPIGNTRERESNRRRVTILSRPPLGFTNLTPGGDHGRTGYLVSVGCHEFGWNVTYVKTPLNFFRPFIRFVLLVGIGRESTNPRNFQNTEKHPKTTESDLSSFPEPNSSKEGLISYPTDESSYKNI